MPHAIYARFLPYSIAVMGDIVAFLLSWLLLPLMTPTVFALFYPAVMVSALYGGFGPGLLATALAAIATKYFFLPEVHSLVFANANTLVRLSVLTAIALMIVGLSTRLRAAKHRAEMNAARLKESQELFQQFMVHSPMTVSIKDQEGRYLYANPLMEQVLGRERSGWYHQTDGDLFPPGTAAALRQADQTVLSTGQSLKLVEPNAGMEGDRAFLSFKFPLHSRDGQRLVAGMGLEITEWQRTEDALRESEARFNRLAQTDLIGFLTWDLEGRILDANNAFLTMIGSTREALQAGHLRWDTLTPPEYHAVDQAAIEELQRVGTNTPFEKEFFRSDGQRVAVLMGSTFLKESSHQGISFVLDLTERKRAEAAARQSEAQLRILADMVPQLIWMSSPDGNTEYVNSRWQQYAQTHADSPLGLNWLELVHPDDVATLIATRTQAIATQQEYELEYRLRLATGEYRWHLTRVVPFKTDQGDLRCWYGTATDIDQRKRIEEALQEREQRFSTLFNGMDDWVLVYPLLADHQPGPLIEVNEQACRKLGYSRDELLTMSVTDIIGTDWINPRFSADKLWGDRHVVVESVHRTRDGRYIPCEVNATLFTLNGMPTVQSICRDITERKHIEAEREQLLLREQASRQAAETANRIKDEFLAVLSHELRSPLNPILGWTKLLQTRTLDPQTTQRALETIERNAKLQTQLIEDLLDVSRILRGKLTLEVAPVNLAEVIGSALETVQLAAEAKEIQIHLHLDASLEPINGDANRLQQIIWNLLSNAVKFTPSGGQIEVRLEKRGGLGWGVEPGEAANASPSLALPSPTIAQITVRDSGKGISADFLPHVFDYFRQQDSTTTRKFGGLGLGLAIVHHLTELHGGTVLADSAGEGQGATFTLCLPLGSPATPSGTGRIAPDRALDGSPAPLQGVQILVIDDEADMREVMATILHQAGARVRVAASATLALSILNEWLPDLLISDIGMPDIDGYMLMRHLRQRSPQAIAQLPAIALTAYAGETDQADALAAGFQRHLSKPITPDALVQAIKSLLQTAV